MNKVFSSSSDVFFIGSDSSHIPPGQIWIWRLRSWVICAGSQNSFLSPKVWVWSEWPMGGDVDSRLWGRSPPLSSLGKPYWRHHHMENGGFFGSCTLHEKESCINKCHLSCPNICVYLFCVQLMVIGCNLHCGSLQLCFLGETWDFVTTRNRAHYVLC